MEEKFQVGIVTSPHGVRGEVKVYPTTDDPRRFRRLKEVTGDNGKQEWNLKIEAIKFFKNMVILKFQGIDSMDEAHKLRNASLFVPRKDAVRLSRDEYFVADLIGMQVVDEEEKNIGILEDVMETGANDVYIIRMEDGKELLLPAIKQCILHVDLAAGRMQVHILDGLLD